MDAFEAITNGKTWTPQSRAVTAVYLLFQEDEVPESTLQERLGYASTNGLRFLMDNLSGARVPVYEPRQGYWALLR